MYILKRFKLRKICKEALSERGQKNRVRREEGMGNGRVDVLVGQWVGRGLSKLVGAGGGWMGGLTIGKVGGWGRGGKKAWGCGGGWRREGNGKKR